MILGILMSKSVQIAVLETQVERLVEKQKELTERVRANEKVVAAIGLLGSIALAFIGAGYFAPKAEANIKGNEWIQQMRNWEAEQKRKGIDIEIDDSLLLLNNTLTEQEDGQDGSTEQEELLQLPSSVDRQSIGRRHDRCHHRSWIRFIQERTGKNCGCGHTREEDKRP